MSQAVFISPSLPCIVILFWADSGGNSDDNSFKQSTLQIFIVYKYTSYSFGFHCIFIVLLLADMAQK